MPSPLLGPSIQDLVSLCEDYISGKLQFVSKPEEETKQKLIEPLLHYYLDWESASSEDYYDREFRGKIKNIEWKDFALLTDAKPRIFIETKDCTDKDIDKKYAKELLDYLKDFNADKDENEWVTWGILTNFTKIYFYHWTEKTRSPIPFLSIDFKELPNKILRITFSYFSFGRPQQSSS